ncbi:MAG: 2-deoxy-D-gluconate 3-dehydrogenase, partial [Clostridia bacterium]
MLEKFKLDGKVAVVSGSNQGLGQGMAKGLAEAGCDIIGIDYLPGQLETKAIIEGC